MKTLMRHQLNILFLLTIFLFSFNSLSAQVNWQQLNKLYQDGQFEQLRQALSKADAQEKKSLEFLFFNTLFEKDGEQAVQNYQLVFEQSNGWLKKAAAKKLYDYYFARGFYLKAESYKSYLDQENNTEAYTSSSVTPKQNAPEPGYYIQLGAFGSPANAQKRMDVLKKNGISAEIKIRKINDHNYYCVWVKGRSNFAETDKMARQIKKQLKLEYRIIKE